MKTIKKIVLKDATVLKSEEMKHIFGGDADSGYQAPMQSASIECKEGMLPGQTITAHGDGPCSSTTTSVKCSGPTQSQERNCDGLREDHAVIKG